MNQQAATAEPPWPKDLTQTIASFLCPVDALALDISGSATRCVIVERSVNYIAGRGLPARAGPDEPLCPQRFFVSSLAPAPVCAPGRTGRSASMGRPDRGCTRWESPSRGEKVCGRRVVTTAWSRLFAKAAGRQTLRRPGAAMWCVGRSRRRAPARAIRWSSVRAPAKIMISGFGWLKAPISRYADCEFIASDTARTPVTDAKRT